MSGFWFRMVDCLHRRRPSAEHPKDFDPLEFPVPREPTWTKSLEVQSSEDTVEVTCSACGRLAPSNYRARLLGTPFAFCTSSCWRNWIQGL